MHNNLKLSYTQPMLQKSEPLPKGPKGDFLLGNLRERQKTPLEFYTRIARDFGDYVQLKMGPMNVVFVNNPVGVKRVLVDELATYPKGYVFEKLSDVLGKGLLTSEGAFWRRQRKLAQPAFHKISLEAAVNVMADLSEHAFSNLPLGKNIDFASEMMALTLKIVAQTLLGSDITLESESVRKAISFTLVQGNARLLQFPPIPYWIPTRFNQKLKRSVSEVDRVVYRIINEHKIQRNRKSDLLTLLMNAKDDDTGESMNERQLRDEVFTFFLAGHETTANLMAWFFYEMSLNQEISKKVGKEIENEISSGAPNYESLLKLTYTRRVIDEVLRLHPPAWVIARSSSKEDVMDGYKVPKGSLIAICTYTLHRNPKFWPEPEKFDPDRFLPEISAIRPKYAYIPFGGGPRSCIGSQFSLLEALCLITRFYQKYGKNSVIRLDQNRKVTADAQITLRPLNGMWAFVNPG